MKSDCPMSIAPILREDFTSAMKAFAPEGCPIEQTTWAGFRARQGRSPAFYPVIPQSLNRMRLGRNSHCTLPGYRTADIVEACDTQRTPELDLSWPIDHGGG